jgi:hypothetical protein
MRDKLEIQAIACEAMAELTRLGYQFRYKIVEMHKALNTTAELPTHQQLPFELAILMAQLAREQMEVAKLIVTAIIKLRSNGHAWVETAAIEISAGVLKPGCLPYASVLALPLVGQSYFS